VLPKQLNGQRRPARSFGTAQADEPFRPKPPLRQKSTGRRLVDVSQLLQIVRPDPSLEQRLSARSPTVTPGERLRIDIAIGINNAIVKNPVSFFDIFVDGLPAQIRRP
jgi:hypothetical protein